MRANIVGGAFFTLHFLECVTAMDTDSHHLQLLFCVDGRLIPDCRFKTGNFSARQSVLQGGINRESAIRDAVLLDGFHHGGRRIKEHSDFAKGVRLML